MEAAAATEEAAVLDAGHAEAAAILADAERAVATARERTLGEATASARSRRARLEAEARIQIETREAQARDTMVDRAFARATEVLQSYRQSDTYPSTLQTLLSEAEGQFPPDQELVVRCDPRDLATIGHLVAGRPDARVVDASLACWGGVQVTDSTGSIACDNSLERRLERARETLRWDVAALFLASWRADPQDTGSV